MTALRLLRRAVGWVVLLIFVVAALSSARGFAQQSAPIVSDEPQIAALAERLAVQLLAANKKKLFILDITLPGDIPSPLGVWLADKISDCLAQAHPELQVIPRSRWNSEPRSAKLFHDKNEENAANEVQAHALGADIIVRGNFAAVDDALGITLMASDRASGGNSRFEALADVPLTPEMRALVTSALPGRPFIGGAYKASTGGIGSPICDVCPAPEYTYVAKAKKLTGVVILHVWVSKQGEAENVTVVRAPDEALGKAAIRGVRNWRFRPALNASGDVVPVVVDVAVAFHLSNKQVSAALNTKNAHPDSN